MATASATIATALMISAGVPGAAFADNTNDFVVQYDQVRLLRLEEKAADVIVGNPSIADVAIQNGKLLAITGKTFGVTNLIILDDEGRVMMNRRLMVASDDQKIVNLTRGSKRRTYNCSPNCQPVMNIGDDTEYYSNVSAASQKKIKFSSGVSSGSNDSGE